MPFYEYQCQRCGHHLESMQKVSDPPLRKCPDCGKPSLKRLMSAPVFRLKGGGWYETDFKGDAEGKRNLADRPEAAAAKDDKKEPPAKDAKPADAAAKDAAAPAKEDKKPAAAPVAAAKPSSRRGSAAARAPAPRPAARPVRKAARKAPARRR